MPGVGGSMFLGWWLNSESPQGSRLVDSLGLPVEFLPLLGPSTLPPTLPRESTALLAVGLYICLCLLDEASREKVPACMHDRVSLTVFGVGPFKWNES